MVLRSFVSVVSQVRHRAFHELFQSAASSMSCMQCLLLISAALLSDLPNAQLRKVRNTHGCGKKNIDT